MVLPAGRDIAGPRELLPVHRVHPLAEPGHGLGPAGLVQLVPAQLRRELQPRLARLRLGRGAVLQEVKAGQDLAHLAAELVRQHHRGRDALKVGGPPADLARQVRQLALQPGQRVPGSGTGATTRRAVAVPVAPLPVAGRPPAPCPGGRGQRAAR